MMKRTLLFALLGGILLFVSPPSASQAAPLAPCIAGMADTGSDQYPCYNVNLLGHLSLAELGATDETVFGNDHWGWTDPDTGKNYVIFGLTDSTAFVDISDPTNPLLLGNLPARGGASVWRDIKVYQNHAYIAGDIPTISGLQVFDLTQLRTVVSPPVTFSETAHDATFGPGHNLWINEELGNLYVFRTDVCGGGILTYDITTPASPVYTGCFAETDTPLSDAECVVYRGPDVDYTGHELCFVASDDNMTVYDVTDKADVRLLADMGYAGISRAHQGSLTTNERYWIMTDVMDEVNNGTNTRTYLFDMLDIDAPVFLGYYEHNNTSRDHNAYIVGNTLYQSNWMAGFRMFDISAIPSTDWQLLGYFDIEPSSDSPASTGAWNNYPWWGDDIITISGVNNGLFVLQYAPQAPTDVSFTHMGGVTQTGVWYLLLGGVMMLWLLGMPAFLRRQTSKQTP